MTAMTDNRTPRPMEPALQSEQPPCILLVEDDSVLRQTLAASLSAQGYRVMEAESRKTALTRLAEQDDIAVMILDLGLPPREHSTDEGLAVIRAVSSDMLNIKIIVLTGQDEESAALAAIREGAFDFLSKPAGLADILTALNRALLFQRKEKDLSSEGTTRLQINATLSDGLKAVREETEEKLVRKVLKETGFNVYQSASRLGLKRESLYYFMKKFGIRRGDD